MSKYRRYDTSAGRQGRTNRSLQKQISQQASAKRLRRSEFPVGSIPFTALETALTSGTINQVTSGFGVLAVGGPVFQFDITVPDGVRAASIDLHARVYAVNTTLVNDYLLARVDINDTQGLAFGVLAYANGTDGDAALNPCGLPLDLSASDPDPLPTIHVSVWAQVAGGVDWLPDPSNMAELTGTVRWSS